MANKPGRPAGSGPTPGSFKPGDNRASSAGKKSKRPKERAEIVKKEQDALEAAKLQEARHVIEGSMSTLDRIRELEGEFIEALQELLQERDSSVVRWVGSRLAPDVVAGDEELQAVLKANKEAMEAIAEENAKLQERLALYEQTPAIAQVVANATANKGT
ncbi:hypothetical protein [Ruegeria arenilitoris]|uniref:hypothetical protein n=1 Tax=Ruegeria arenilitoris TaxID=1173585 RepID=UPI00147CE07F|nr:hypothetical protein [Ruegeria arenilitoris]